MSKIKAGNGFLNVILKKNVQNELDRKKDLWRNRYQIGLGEGKNDPIMYGKETGE